MVVGQIAPQPKRDRRHAGALGDPNGSPGAGFFASTGANMTNEPEYVPALEAAKMVGMSDAALRRRIQRGLVPVYRDPADRRFRLLKVSDLEEMVSTRRVVPVADTEGA